MDQPSWDLTMGAAIGGEPSCKSYIGFIQQLVELYGEGPSSPFDYGVGRIRQNNVGKQTPRGRVHEHDQSSHLSPH